MTDLRTAARQALEALESLFIKFELGILAIVALLLGIWIGRRGDD
jgi:hypothetical protein